MVQDKIYCTPVAQELVQSFRFEQTAVLGFVFQIDMVRLIRLIVNRPFQLVRGFNAYG